MTPAEADVSEQVAMGIPGTTGQKRLSHTLERNCSESLKSN